MSFLQPYQMQDIKYIRTCVLLLIVYLYYRYLNLVIYLLYSYLRIVVYLYYRYLRIVLAFQQQILGSYLQIYTCINYYQQPYYKFYSQTHLGKLGRRLTNYLVRFVAINSNQYNRGSRNSLYIEQTAIMLYRYCRY